MSQIILISLKIFLNFLTDPWWPNGYWEGNHALLITNCDRKLHRRASAYSCVDGVYNYLEQVQTVLCNFPLMCLLFNHSSLFYRCWSGFNANLHVTGILVNMELKVWTCPSEHKKELPKWHWGWQRYWQNEEISPCTFCISNTLYKSYYYPKLLKLHLKWDWVGNILLQSSTLQPTSTLDTAHIPMLKEQPLFITYWMYAVLFLMAVLT